MDGDTSVWPVISATKRMRHSSGVNADLTNEQVEVFRVLYPIFKDEVFRTVAEKVWFLLHVIIHKSMKLFSQVPGQNQNEENYRIF